MSSSRGSPEPVRVLVIDDDPAVRRLLAAALASLATTPTEIREAVNLEGGLAAARERTFDAAVVALDIGPPSARPGSGRRYLKHGASAVIP